MTVPILGLSSGLQLIGDQGLRLGMRAETLDLTLPVDDMVMASKLPNTPKLLKTP